jgi:hypothetical protein
MKAEKPELKWEKNSKGTYDSLGLKKPNLAWERLKKINELEKALASSEQRIKELKNREIELAQIAKGEMTPLKEFPDYSITRDGKVFRTTFRNGHTYKKYSEPYLVKGNVVNGYHHVGLSKDGRIYSRFVHNLVLETFVSLCPKGQEASHLNGNRMDNRVENLIYETRKENMARKHLHGTAQCGENNHLTKLKEEDVREIRRLLEAGNLQIDVARQFNITASCISKIASNKNWKYLDGKRKTWREWAKDKEALEQEIARLKKENELLKKGVVPEEQFKVTFKRAKEQAVQQALSSLSSEIDKIVKMAYPYYEEEGSDHHELNTEKLFQVQFELKEVLKAINSRGTA